MDSLVASYASSDEEEQQQPQPRKQPLVSSLPPPKSSLPKRVVQINLPINPRPTNSNSDDDEEEERARKKRKEKESSISHNSSVKSFLSAMPAPKQTLGSLPSLGSGLSRRSNVEIETQTELGIIDNQNASFSSETVVDNNYYDGGYEQSPSVSVGYDDGSSYGGSSNTWNSGGNEMPEAFIAMDRGARRGGRKGRNEMPTEIIEVKQDELMKNRPRVDPAKSTGLAFGPAYQPDSSKGKVSKLHKRKHQITALFMDMKHKESELADRRSRGFLTKAETQAKYGW